MLTEAEVTRLTELLQKTDKTSEEATELAGLRSKAIEAPNETAPAPLPKTPLPTSLDEALAQFQDLKAQFVALKKKATEDQETIALLKAGQDAIASGQVRVLFRHCNVDGRKLRAGEERCPCGGATNHVGLNPANGIMMLVKQT